MNMSKTIVAVAFSTILAISLVGCGASGMAGGSSSDESVQASATASLKSGDRFPSFKATDLVTGKEVDESVFAQNKVTVVSYWFNGCSACVNEMPILEQLQDQLGSQGVGVLGVNVEAASDEELKKEAQEILSKQGVTYSNIAIDPDTDGAKVANGIMAFPTTFLVDQNGNVIGEPMRGSINELEGSELLQRVNDALAAAQS